MIKRDEKGKFIKGTDRLKTAGRKKEHTVNKQDEKIQKLNGQIKDLKSEVEDLKKKCGMDDKEVWQVNINLGNDIKTLVKMITTIKQANRYLISSQVITGTHAKNLTAQLNEIDNALGGNEKEKAPLIIVPNKNIVPGK